MILFFSLFFFFSPPAEANTLAETATAVGIANTLQQTQQGAVRGHVEQAKNTVQEYQSAMDEGYAQHIREMEQRGMERMRMQEAQEARAFEHMRRPEEAFHEDPHHQEHHDGYIFHRTLREELFSREKEGNSSQKNNVDYKAKTVVFYKKDCAKTDTSCQKSHPVLTNIKSVIFNHAQGRLLASTKKK